VGHPSEEIREKGAIRGRSYLIYVTVGNHCQGFERLIKVADTLACRMTEKFFAQIGYSTYLPTHMEFVRFEPYHESIEHIRQARCVISHAGIGTIIKAKNYKVPMVIAPRRKAFGEHFSDHQMEITTKVTDENRRWISIAEPLNTLETLVRQAIEKRPVWDEKEMAGRAAIVALIKDFVWTTAAGKA